MPPTTMRCKSCGMRKGHMRCGNPAHCRFEDDMTDRDPLLVEREKTHGSFEVTASIAQELKGIFHKYGVARGLDHPFSVQVEALDMIATKLARILSGNAHVKDHWKDLSGYSLLGMEACDDDKAVR